jgi:hypothetical protein
MMNHRMLKSAVLVVMLLSLFPQPAAAYVGPGVGLGAVGVFLAIVAAFVVAIFGFIWYPIKRLLRMFKKQSNDQKDNDQKDNHRKDEGPE